MAGWTSAIWTVDCGGLSGVPGVNMSVEACGQRDCGGLLGVPGVNMSVGACGLWDCGGLLGVPGVNMSVGVWNMNSELFPCKESLDSTVAW